MEISANSNLGHGLTQNCNRLKPVNGTQRNVWRYQRDYQIVVYLRRTDNTMVKRKRTDNTMVKRRGTDNTMVKRRRTDNTMVKRRRTDNTMVKRKRTMIYVENYRSKERAKRNILQIEGKGQTKHIFPNVI